MQLILWRENPVDPLKTFSLNTVSYGTASAPFLATRCLKQLAIEHSDTYPLASKTIEHDFYIDDLLSGCESIDDVTKLCTDVSHILGSAKFELRKWKSNSPTVLENIMVAHSSADDILHFNAPEVSKTLGMVGLAAMTSFHFTSPLQEIYNM